MVFKGYFDRGLQRLSDRPTKFKIFEAKAQAHERLMASASVFARLETVPTISRRSSAFMRELDAALDAHGQRK